MICNDESVNEVILGQIRICFLEFPNLLRIEYMDLALEAAQAAILA